MLENLNQVILNLEKSLNMLAGNQEVELLNHPEYLEAVKEVVQSIQQVTHSLKKLEASYRGEESPGRATDANNEKPSESADRIIKIVRKKAEDRRASSN